MDKVFFVTVLLENGRIKVFRIRHKNQFEARLEAEKFIEGKATFLDISEISSNSEQNEYYVSKLGERDMAKKKAAKKSAKKKTTKKKAKKK